jgi:diacylglycerol kinase
MTKLRIEDGRIKIKLFQLPISNWELLGMLGLFSLVVFLIGSSWRKWLDPQIDYGRELYIPWRMLEGGKLFKDVDDLYGPLSRFIDLGLFKFFGPGMMVLAWANIVLYFVVLGLVYYVFRKAWGFKAALLCAFIFVGVFSFSQLVITSNYNFVTPYSQQATHGFLVCLALIALLPRWIDSVSYKRSFYVGLLVGLTLVLKPEFILASGLILCVAFLFRIRRNGVPYIRELLVGFVGIILPTSILFCYFTTYLNFNKAFFSASFAWMNGLIIWKDEYTAHLLNNFSGMDQPREHLISHIRATAYGLALVVTIGLISWLIGKLIGKVSSENHQVKLMTKDTSSAVLVIALLSGVAWLALNKITWVETGPALLGLLLILSLFKAWGWKNACFGSHMPQEEALKALLIVFAGALITRMVLNGRIYQYGFIQASLATLVIVAIIYHDVGAWVKSLSKEATKVGLAFQGSVFVLSFIGVALIMTQSQKFLQAKTLAIGEGSDLFYSFPAQISYQGELVRTFSSALSKRPKEETLLVLPEGIMVNYLARKKSPVSDLTLYTNKEAEIRIVQTLDTMKPDWVVVLSRDLTEYGVTRYGSKGQSGEQIISWMKDKYKVSASLGGDPLDPKQLGGIVYGNTKTVMK